MTAVDLDAMRALFDALALTNKLLRAELAEITAVRDELQREYATEIGHGNVLVEQLNELDDQLAACTKRADEAVAARDVAREAFARVNKYLDILEDELRLDAALTAALDERDAARAERKELREVLESFVRALPACDAHACGRAATSQDEYQDDIPMNCCDEHAASRKTEDMEYAPALRAAVALLERLAGRLPEGTR